VTIKNLAVLKQNIGKDAEQAQHQTIKNPGSVVCVFHDDQLNNSTG